MATAESARAHLFKATERIGSSDLQSLSEFLRSRASKTERDLQYLFERHPAIASALGFCEFFTEYPLLKTGNNNEPLLDGCRRDRVDILAAKGTAPLDSTGQQHRSAHIIELKKAHENVLYRNEGFRPSDAANDAVSQLGDYYEWLKLEPNRQALQNFGWSVWEPMKILIMGSRDEFKDSPARLDAIRERFLKERNGVRLFLVEEILELCEQARVVGHVVPTEYLVNLRAPSISALPVILAAYGGLAGLVLECSRNALSERRTQYGTIDVRESLPDGLVHITRKRLQPLARKIGIPFANALVAFTKSSKWWKPLTHGIVIAVPDHERLEQAIKEQEARNTPQVKELRQRYRRRVDERYTREFAEAIRKRFPSMPPGEEDVIAERATEVGSGRVGRSTTADDAVVMSVAAHVRWNYTEYGEILDEVHEWYRSLRSSERKYMPPPKEEAMSRVSKRVRQILLSWERNGTP